MKKIIVVCAAAAVLLAGKGSESEGGPAPNFIPTFTKDGKLVRPTDYREWVFLSSGLGMSYSPSSTDEPDPTFDNVFVAPAAYRAFLRTGTWPDKTMFILEERSSASHGSINKGGHFQTELEGLEAEVKDEARFPKKWAFFGFGDSATARQIPTSASCYSCHAANAAVDNTFVQFYPTLLKVAKEKGTLRKSQ